jgi:hypothetical protein
MFINSMIFWMRSLGSSVSIAMGYGLDGVQTKSIENQGVFVPFPGE